MHAKTPLRIGIDGTCLGSRRGYGRFLREVLPRLADRASETSWLLFLDSWTATRVESPPDIETIVVPTSASQADAASGHGNRGLRDLLAMGFAVARSRLDVMYFPSVYSYFPVPARVPVAVAFHDTIAERHADVVFPGRRTRWLWQAKVALARWQAARVITVSEWSRRRLHECFGIPLDEIRVAVEAPAAVFEPAGSRGPLEAWLAGHGLPPDARYFLYVGGFNPHKNLLRLVSALAATPEADAMRLILVGDPGDVFHSNVAALRDAIGRAGLADRVLFAGFVPDEDLRHLYAGAVAVLLPSLEEGFGLPAVEGAACGAPCVATRNSPLPELLADGGLFVDPLDEGAIGAALGTMAADPARRETLARGALEAASRLTWEVAARATRDALIETVRGRDR